MEAVDTQEREKHSVWITNYEKKPFNSTRIQYDAMKLIGYPIAYGPSTMPASEQDSGGIFTDSKDSMKKMHKLREAVILKSAWNSLSLDLKLALPYDFFDALTDSSDQQAEALRTSFDKEILERALVATVEGSIERAKESDSLWRRKEPVRQDVMEYYIKIKDDVPPLNEEGIVLMIASAMKAYLKDHPELKPVSPKAQDEERSTF